MWPSILKPRSTRRRKLSRRSSVVCLECLEDRRLLTTFTVLNSNDSGDGSLRAAIAAANNEVANPGHDTIVFAADVTQVTLTSGGLALFSEVTIAGPTGGVTIARDAAEGTPQFGIFFVASGTTTVLENLTITGGRTNAGGGILNFGTLTVNSSTLSGNSAALVGGGISNFDTGMLTVTGSTLSGNSALREGGGIYNLGMLTVTDSTVSGNSAPGGGGMRNTGTLTVMASILSDNSANSGGGIANAGTLTVTTSTLSGNSAAGSGGGIQNQGTATVSSSTFSGNSASSGGGILNGATLTVSSSTFSGNSATSSGGGIYNFVTLTVSSSTLSGNSAGSFGGGILNGSSAGIVVVSSSTLSSNSAGSFGGGILNFGTLTVSSSTLSGNSAASFGGGIFNSGAVTATLNNTIVANSPAGGNLFGVYAGSHNLIGAGDISGLLNTITGDPLLGPLANNGGPTMTHALLIGSPAINAGSNVLAVDAEGNLLAFDQRGTGFARILAGTVDIGAFEFTSNRPPVAGDVAVTILEDTQATGNVLDNAFDPDGDALSVMQFDVDGTTYDAGQVAAIAGIGTLVIDADGAYTFNPVADFNGPVPVATYTVSDGNLTATSTLTIHVTPVNDAPTLSVPDEQTTAENIAVTIFGIAVADVDVNEGDGTIRITLSVGSGTLTLVDGIAEGLVASQIAGNGTGTVVLEGLIDAVNNTLGAGVTYLGTLYFHGTETLSIVANDLGNTGSPGAQTAAATVSIQVLSAADQVAEQQALLLALFEQGVLDQDQINALQAKLNRAEDQLAAGKTRVAYNLIGAFIFEVEDLVATGVLTTEQAEPLLSRAYRLRESLLIGGGF